MMHATLDNLLNQNLGFFPSVCTKSSQCGDFFGYLHLKNERLYLKNKREKARLE